MALIILTQSQNMLVLFFLEIRKLRIISWIVMNMKKLNFFLTDTHGAVFVRKRPSFCITQAFVQS